MASAYIDEKVQIGDVLEMSAPRGNFTLQPGDAPVVLLSAGVGATPVIAMLHALAAEASRREIWWLYGARSGREHPFAQEVRSLLKAMPAATVTYATARPAPRTGWAWISTLLGRLDVGVLRELEVPRNADFFICGPSAFMSDLTAGLAAWGVARGRIHTELFGPEPSITPGVVSLSAAAAAPACRGFRRGPAGFIRSQRRECPLGIGLSEPARARRSLRHTDEMVVPRGSLSHLRNRACGGDGHLPARPDRSAGGRQRADLLFAASGRRRHRSLMAMRFGDLSNGA